MWKTKGRWWGVFARSQENGKGEWVVVIESWIQHQETDGCIPNVLG